MAPRLFRLKKRHLSTIVSVISIFIFVGQYYGWFDSINKNVTTSQPGLYQITKFDDGDTIVVDMHGQNETIRFIGVDTPETHDPRKVVQCFGEAASAHTKQLIGNQRVRLELDPLSSNRDRYDRLLRYVYLPDGTLVNKQIIRDGYGFAYTSFPFTKADDFKASQIYARTHNLGLWNECDPEANEYGGYTSNPAAL
jgi:micrococcal nuclease